MKPSHDNRSSAKPVAGSRSRHRSRVEMNHLELKPEDLNPETPATIRERRRRTAGKGVRIAALIFFFMGIVSASHVVIQKAFNQNSKFLLNHITIETKGALSQASLREVMGLEYGVNLLEISLVDIRKKIEALPQVKKASVVREYPGGIKVRVEQRQPIAWLERLGNGMQGVNLALIDKDGVVLPSQEDVQSLKDLPVFQVFSLKNFEFGKKFESQMLSECLSWYQAYNNSELAKSQSVHSVLALKPFSLSVRFDRDYVVNFPTEDYEHNLKRLGMVLKRAEQARVDLETVDLLVQEFVPITLKRRVA